jgi:multisubunit Na+/H+ antiporter MnhB subunit
VFNAIGRSIVSIALGLMSIYFGYKAKNNKEGISVIIVGVIILILVFITYIVGIIPCALN